MQIIPLIKLKNRQITEESLKGLDKIDEGKTVYIYDLDGIEKDKPDLCIYQKLSKKYDIWVDSTPKNLGDVVDIFLTGAVAAIIRKTYFPQINIESIREISENKVYEYAEEKEILSKADGLIINEDASNFDLAKKYSNQYDVFVYEKNIENLSYWINTNIKGLLVDVNKWEEANTWIQKKKS